MKNISFPPLYVNNTYLPSLVIRHLTDVSNTAIYRRFGNAVQVAPFPAQCVRSYNLTEIIPCGIL